jgi:hypothetical protein
MMGVRFPSPAPDDLHLEANQFSLFWRSTQVVQGGALEMR